jgi:hypothetical protein
MDITTSAQLYFFGALFAGGAVGFLVGQFSRFETGLGVGLLIPGIVAAWFAWRCLDEFQAYTAAGADVVSGEVIAVEDVPVNESGSITQPVPVLRYATADRVVHTIRGPAASGLDPGDKVAILHDPADPQRSRVGQPSQLRGAAIAMMLFGTFPLSLGLWFLYGSLMGTSEERRLAAAAAAKRKVSPLRARLLRDSTYALYFAMFVAIVWVAAGTGPLERRFVLGFGGIAVALAGYALRSLLDPRTGATSALGFLMLGVNFGVWAYALHLLT